MLITALSCGYNARHVYRQMSTLMTTTSLAHLLRRGWVTMVLLAITKLAVAAMPPVLFYSDLDSGPNSGGQDDKGVFVTVWGRNFGAARGAGSVTIGNGAAATYLHWSDTKIIFQIGNNATTGDIVVTTADGVKSNGISFTVRPGRIFFTDANAKSRGSGAYEKPWRTPESYYNRIKPGDTLYFRAGVYAENYGGNWGNRNFALGAHTGGSPGRPVAFVGYPNEMAVLKAPPGDHGNFSLIDSSRTTANYVTIANLVLQGAGDCIGGGGFWQTAHGGATNVRVVGNVLSARYTGNTMTGLITVQNDHWRVLGNEMKDTGTTPPINNNHGIYVQTGASDIEVAWNYFHDLRMGHVIQVHTDIYYLYRDVRIHDNVITGAKVNGSRGINVGRALPGTYGAIYNNVLYNIGQDFSAIAIYSGDWKIYNNTLHNIHATSGMVWVSNQGDGRPTATIVNNIFYSDGSSPYVSALHGADRGQLMLANNLYFGYRGLDASTGKGGIVADPRFQDPATGDFHLRPGSPAIDHGSDTVAPIVSRDHDGVPRPQGRHFDIGAFEAVIR